MKKSMSYSTRKSIKSLIACFGAHLNLKMHHFFPYVELFSVYGLNGRLWKILAILFQDFWIKKFMGYSTRKLEKSAFAYFGAHLNMKMHNFSTRDEHVLFLRSYWTSSKDFGHFVSEFLE